MFVKKGDKVRVIAGKDKGVEALVVAALPKVNKVVVEGVNLVKKHQSMCQTFKFLTKMVLQDVLTTSL